MSRFRSDGRTLVTKIESFVTDIYTRQAAFKNSSAVKLDPADVFNNVDINVSDVIAYTVPQVKNFIQLQTPETVTIEIQDNANQVLTSFDVDGLFILHGTMTNTVVIKGKSTANTRCSLIYS